MPRFLKFAPALALAGLCLSLNLACDKGENKTGSGSSANSSSSSASASANLTGAGSSFANPLYQKWISEYTRLHNNIQINYQSIGSGAGIKQLIANTVDFAGTDAPMNAEQMKEAPGEVLHVPTALGAVVPMYNIPGVDKALKFTGPILSEIFLGKITKWNDPKLVEMNGDAKLPDMAISIVHRSDGSGTTGIFTEYLTKVSPEWLAGPGKGSSVKWPVGVGAKGSEGVSGMVKQTPGTISYVELLYALNNKIAYGDVVNAAGKTIHATAAGVSAAAGSIKEVPDDLKLSVTNAAGDASYPISGFTWMLIYKNQKDGAKGKALADFAWWGVHDGQAFHESLNYAPLPKELLPKCETMIKSIVGPDGKQLVDVK
jgi:phosphate transport system substrate-binding protein